MHWHQADTKTVLKETGSSENGLTSEEAQKRLQQYGPNTIRSAKQKSPVIIFLLQFKDFMILVLIGAALVSGLLGDATDTLVILSIVLLNAMVGFIQEYRAEKAMEVLKKMAVINTVVLRNNAFVTLASSELVPGDIVQLEDGNIVPADMRLLQAVQLKANESSLTGESVPVDKQTEPLPGNELSLGDYSNMVFKGTYLTYGRGRGVVVATGMRTEFGRIAGLLQQPAIQTPLQKRLEVFGKNLAYIILFICFIVFTVGYMRGEEIVLMLLTALSLAVAAIPEALPAVITIALAIGARKMARKNALIRRLPAVETLGSVTYICSDKTGTLTVNKMTVEEVCGEHFYVKDNELAVPDAASKAYAGMLTAMALNNDVYHDARSELMGDPTELAVYQFAAAAGFQKGDCEIKYPRVTEIPFDSQRKCMTTIHQFQDQYLVITKGAMELLLQKSVPGTDIRKWNRLLDGMLEKGLRVLGYATRKLSALPADISAEVIERDLEIVGMAGMIDPPRPEALQAVQECKEAGIRPVMITGDHPTTATVIAKRLGIIDTKADRIVSGAELRKMSEQELVDLADHIKVYARVSPEQKLNIVKALQKQGQYVAMTGDGVNDAPALKHANIGIAMGVTGTDVSREAAHMVLLDDNFATIVKAIREGRRIYDNIRKFIRYILTGNSAEIWTIFLAPFFALPIPLLPIHILWINLVTDGLPGLALAAEPAEPSIMQRPPRNPGQSIFAEGLGIHVLWVGLLLAAATIGTQAYAIHIGDAHWQTMVFTVLCFGQLAHVLAIQSERVSVLGRRLFSNKFLVMAVAGTFILQLTTIYVPFLNTVFKTQPLTAGELAISMGMASSIFFFVEFEKWLRRRKNGW